MLILTIIALLAIIIAAAALALVIRQYRRMEQTAAQQEAWEGAQQSHLRTWEIQQERHFTDLETRLTAQFQEIQQAWQKWEAKDAERMETLARDYEVATTQLRLEHELARISRIEDTPLGTDAHGQTRPSITNWRPPMLHQADLRKLDLSHRYLGHADLREAQLTDATLFMANLSGANLSGADLSNADLSGADLSGADLRDAILTGANLLVVDLHNAILTGANLIGVRSLTMDQLHSAVFDSSTLLDSEIDATPIRVQKVRKSESEMTSPRMEAVHPTAQTAPAPLPTAAPEPDVQPEVLSSPLAPDMTSFVQHLTEPSAEPVPSATPMIDAFTPAESAKTEPSAPSATLDKPTETPSATLIPNTFTQQVDGPAPLSSLTFGDSLLDPKVADLLVDRPESKRIEESGTATPRRRHNGKRAAKQN